MAFIRIGLLTLFMAVAMGKTIAQTIYYPAQSSQLLKATAADLAMLLKKAIPTVQFTTSPYTQMPPNGIILSYDSTVSGDQSCRVQCNGTSMIRFMAPQDNGLVYGIYQYLHQSGFRFYQPGTIWEIIPSLSSPYQLTDTIYAGQWKYKSWFISGGCNRWAMDQNSEYGWDTYYGENGHNWALYQRRNGMSGANRFAGHRGDIMTGNYMTAIQNNPCYVASFNGSRQANSSSVPDIHSNASMQLWSSAIEQQYASFRNAIFSNPALYANFYRNFNYYFGCIGIEVPDGARWGNSTDNGQCGNTNYPSASDQHFTLAGFTAQKMNEKFPGKQLQLYAYSSHAGVPSSSISIPDNIDVQVIPTAFQNESSAKGLMNRWYNKKKSVSEYHYLNIPQWGGETPMFFLDELNATLNRAIEKKSQGIVWEASPAKFASLPFLFAANEKLQSNTGVDESLHQFCNNLFGSSANTIYSLLKWWSDDRTVSGGNFITDNRYKLPLYLQLLDEADRLVRNDAPVIKERIAELKAYLHYMVLYYDWISDKRPANDKMLKAAALCTYLAKVNRLQIVNSYFLVMDIVRLYPASSDFYKQFNITNGSAYQNGQMPLITAAEIESNFKTDLSAMGKSVDAYSLTDAQTIRANFKKNRIEPLEKIEVKLLYTNGAHYPNRSEFFIDAPAAGSFSISYTPHFLMPGKGYINFTVENADKALEVIADLSLNKDEKAGTMIVRIPSAGRFKLSVVSKYQSAVDLVITTNGNTFYKNGAFIGSKTENYRDNLASLPGYFYVPEGISKIFFSVNNSGPGGRGYATAEEISKAFVIKDNVGSTLVPRLVIPDDSAFFYLDVPPGNNGTFWRITTMGQYNLCFANISNLQWFAKSAPSMGLPAQQPDPEMPTVFPNPSSGVFHFLLKKGDAGENSIRITDAKGQLVGYFKNTLQFDLGRYPAGLYNYTLTYNGRDYSGKLVRQ